MASAVDAALQEIVASLAAIAPQHEGFRDLDRLNIQASAHTEVQRSIDQYDRRVAFLEAAKLTCEQLLADGHPLLEPREIAEADVLDLQAQAETIAAALAQVRARIAAASIGLQAGAVEPKRRS